MRIFLDFDGVLRRLGSSPSALDTDCVETFAQAVLWQPEAKVVISSTWRLAYSLRELRALLPAALGERVEGVTPEVAHAREHHRHHEILEYLRCNRLRAAAWIAVDDHPNQFRPDAPLIVVDSNRGFDVECGSRLRQWLAAAASKLH